MKGYLASLPEPLTTFEIYHEIRDARNSINEMRNILKKLPNVSYSTLEFITALLLRVSQKSSLNKVNCFSCKFYYMSSRSDFYVMFVYVFYVFCVLNNLGWSSIVSRSCSCATIRRHKTCSIIVGRESIKLNFGCSEFILLCLFFTTSVFTYFPHISLFHNWSTFSLFCKNPKTCPGNL